MLFILFQIGGDRYALPANRIAKILPLVNLKIIPGAPSGVAGLLNFHGTPVPVVDLNVMTLAEPAARRMSTRIILVKYPLEKKPPHLLGLIAENATTMMRRPAQDFVEAGVQSETAPYLGRVAQDARGLIQWIEVEGLLTPEVREVLFRELVES